MPYALHLRCVRCIAYVLRKKSSITYLLRIFTHWYCTCVAYVAYVLRMFHVKTVALRALRAYRWESALRNTILATMETSALYQVNGILTSRNLFLWAQIWVLLEKRHCMIALTCDIFFASYIRIYSSGVLVAFFSYVTLKSSFLQSLYTNIFNMFKRVYQRLAAANDEPTIHWYEFWYL